MADETTRDEPMDWVALQRENRTSLRLGIRKELPETSARLEREPELNVLPTGTLEARRRSFNADLQKVMDTLHRRHVAFTHIPRKAVTRGPKIGQRPHPFTVNRGDQMEYEGPRLTREAKEEVGRKSVVRQRAAAAAGGESSRSPGPGALHERSEYFESVLATSFSPRRQGAETSELPPSVLRSWFRNRAPQSVKASTPTPAISNYDEPRHDVTQLTQSSLRRQGFAVDPPLHRGDGYLSGADRLQLRREYAEEVYGYRKLRHHEHRRTSSPPKGPNVNELLQGVFVKAGDVGSFIRQDAKAAGGGQPRNDVRRSMKVRLGGTSKPRV